MPDLQNSFVQKLVEYVVVNRRRPHMKAVAGAREFYCRNLCKRHCTNVYVDTAMTFDKLEQIFCLLAVLHRSVGSGGMAVDNQVKAQLFPAIAPVSARFP